MDLDQILRGLLALVFVLGLIGAIALIARRFGLSPRVTRARRSRTAGRKRLSIAEVLQVDAKRRLILVRRDDTEHLILLGADRDLVVEAGAAPPPDETDLYDTVEGPRLGRPQDTHDGETA